MKGLKFINQVLERIKRMFQIDPMREMQKHVKRKLKKALGEEIFSNFSESRRLIKDVRFLHCDLLHYLTIAQFASKEEYLGNIKNWLSLEKNAYQYNHHLKYVPGQAKALTNLIIIRHKMIEKMRAITLQEV